MIRIAVLGSTGSIGTQTLDIVRQFPDRFQVVGLTAGQNASALQDQADEFGVKSLALMNDPQRSGLPTGLEAVTSVACDSGADVVVVSVAGVIGLGPTVAAIQAGKRIALASKEVLVAAGSVVMPLLAKHGVSMTPIDSEHSAVFQCLQGYRPDQVDEIILTASGGPFRGWTRDQLKTVTLAQALNHPTWRMGGKITIDSATMMNKGLEMIEARWLFGNSVDQVKVVVHPQSIVHSMVKFTDGSVLGQLGWPNMRLPILYSLTYPERPANAMKPWNPVDTPTLTFESVDEDVFECLKLARQADKAGGTMACTMNAANEEAVNSFLREEIGFLDIPGIVSETMATAESGATDLAGLLSVDTQSRRIARNLIEAVRG